MRIAFDLDETLGIPIIDGVEIVGFRFREGCIELLEKLKQKHELVLWTVSSRRYVEKVLSYGLKKYFYKTFTWDDLPVSWKDVRKINADFLIDDNEDYRNEAKKIGLERKYIVVAAYGSLEDSANPRLWIEQVENFLLKEGKSK